MARLDAISCSIIFVSSALAMQRLAAIETPFGLMAEVGMSPKPTPAPGFHGMPKELLRRQDYQYPPPHNWCGFVSGDYSDLLSCSTSFTCAFSGSLLGCCSSTTGTCTDIYTSCVGYIGTCGSSCRADRAVLKCSSAKPWCGTYSFSGGTYLYNCQESLLLPQTVEFLNDFYISAIGSTLATMQDLTAASSSSQTRPGSISTLTSNVNNDDVTNSAGLAAAAIGGICAGVGILAIILGVIVFFCIRRRRNNRIKQSQQQAASMQNTGYGGAPPPTMQQQSPGYQPVPQQDGQYLSPGPQYAPLYAPTQQSYPDPSKTPVIAHVTPASPSAVSDPRQSTFGGSGISSPSPTLAVQQSPPPATQERDSYYKPPTNANTMEVDGTQGNPGVPYGGTQQYQEVDGTQGNPGVPHQGQRPQGPYEMH